LYFPEENNKQLDQDEIIEILDQDKTPEWHEVMVMPKLKFLKCLMKNLCLISRVWRTWRRSGTQNVSIFPHCQ
jgi:hypothetical protein